MARPQVTQSFNSSVSRTAGPQRGMLIFIMATVFLNLAGIGIINPVAPFLVGQYVGQRDIALVTTLLLASYALSQFIAVPTLGALSDRFGRRPVLIISLFGSAVGYLIMGIGGALVVLFLGRIIDGLTGGNIAIADAYLADITRKEERTRYYGILGAAAGMGLVIGPALGGLIYRLTDSYAAPLYFAAGVALLNTLLGVFILPESLPVDKRSAIQLKQLNPLGQLVAVLRIAHLRWLLLGIFIWVSSLTLVQALFAPVAQDQLGWQPDTIGLVFLVWGVVSIIIQAGLIRRLLPRFGDVRLAVAGIIIMIVGYMLFALVVGFRSEILVWPGVIITAVGASLATPTLTSLLSQSVSEQEQGRTQGGSQSLQALGRVIGPLWGGWTYQGIGAVATYVFAAVGLVLAVIIISSTALQQVSRRQEPSSS